MTPLFLISLEDSSGIENAYLHFSTFPSPESFYSLTVENSQLQFVALSLDLSTVLQVFFQGPGSSSGAYLFIGYYCDKVPG